jgi:hypothetical protein
MSPEIQEPKRPPSSAQEAVDWYRRLDQADPPIGHREYLETCADFIDRKYHYGFRVANGEQHTDEPYILDAACMYMEAARLEDDSDKRDGLRQRARTLLGELMSKEGQEPSVLIDSLMYYTDLSFQDQYDRLVRGETDMPAFETAWLECFRESRRAFLMVCKMNGGNDNHLLGRYLEWFRILQERKRQFVEGRVDDEFVRSTFLREDRGFQSQRDGSLSGNFDISFDAFDESVGTWRPVEYLQLTMQNRIVKRTNYQEHISVQNYIFRMPDSETVEIMRKSVAAIADRIRAIVDPSYVLPALKIEDDKAGTLLVSSFF